MGSYILIPSGPDTFRAYVAQPEVLPAPSVVVLHEVFGVNADLRQTCDDLADHGFIAICPDLFWRQMPGVDLNVLSETDWQTGLALYAAFDREKGVLDVENTVRIARTFDHASGKVGILGYCLGGLLVFLTAARSEVDAAVAFHGADTEKYLDEVSAISAPMLMHLAEADEFIPKAAQAAIKAACAVRPNIEIQSYAGCLHAFSRHGGAHYDSVSAALANDRTRAFLTAHLK